MTDLRETLQAAVGTAYRVEHELEGGGMSRLFLATETALDRRVVIKVLPGELSASLDAERFRAEMQVAARLAHPNIVPILAAGEAPGLLYYTMPYVEGESLRDRLARGGALPVSDAVAILRDLARALAFAHAHGVVHRDVKPGNVLLVPGGALLTDFGIARAVDAAARREFDPTGPGFGVGTPAYVSPEQAAGDADVDGRADLYSLGVVAFEMLAGEPPFARRGVAAVLAAHVGEAAPSLAQRRPGVPRELARLVARLLAKRPTDRPKDAGEVLSALETEAALAVARPRIRRRLIPALVSGAILLLLVGDFAGPRLATVVDADAAARQRPVRLDSVAVLAFTPVGRDARERTFAAGLADEIASALGAVPGVRVALRTSVAALRHRRLPARALADSLGVGALLEGTVEWLGDSLRVTAQLTDAHDGLTRWSDTYARSTRDLFAAQDDIARRVVQGVAHALGAQEPGG